MDVNDILIKIKESFKNALGVNPDIIKPGATPEQIEGWDSLGHGVVAMELEKTFSISFEIDDLMDMEDIDSMIKVIQRKIQ